MSTPFIEMPQREDGVAADDQQPAAAGRPGRLARGALDDNRARHHVLRHPDAAVAVHADDGVLVHAGAVVAHVALDVDLQRRVEADRDRVAPPGVAHAPAICGAVGLVGGGMQAGIELAQRRLLEVDDLDGRLGSGRHQTSARSQT